MSAQPKSLNLYAKCPALRLSSRQVGVRGAWLSVQAARYRVTAAQAQPFGLGLFAHMAAASLSHVSTYVPSFFLALRANSFQRGALGI